MSTEDVESVVLRLGRALSESHCVRLGYLFGSRGRGGARPDSDYDIAVLLTEEAAQNDRFRTISGLAGRLGREVCSDKLDIVILNDAPILLRQRVLRDGKLLFQRSDADRVRFAKHTITEYQDSYIRRAEFARRRIARLKSGTSYGGRGDLLEKARRTARLLAKAKGVS